jgi:spore germination protein GerM
MKILPPFALLLLLGYPVMAQQAQPAPSEDNTVRTELLMLEQDVDKTLLREAMLQLGRKALIPRSERPNDADARKREESDARHLMDFIESKKVTIAERATEMRKLRNAPNQVRTALVSSQPQRGPRANQPNEQDRLSLIEKAEADKIEAQLLQRQVQLYQQPLDEALEALANAEFAANKDATQKDKLEAARKEFEKARSKYLEISTKYQDKQGRLNEMQQMTGMGGMGGGFR